MTKYGKNDRKNYKRIINLPYVEMATDESPSQFFERMGKRLQFCLKCEKELAENDKIPMPLGYICKNCQEKEIQNCISGMLGY